MALMWYVLLAGLAAASLPEQLTFSRPGRLWGGGGVLVAQQSPDLRDVVCYGGMVGGEDTWNCDLDGDRIAWKMHSHEGVHTLSCWNRDATRQEQLLVGLTTAHFHADAVFRKSLHDTWVIGHVLMFTEVPLYLLDYVIGGAIFCMQAAVEGVFHLVAWPSRLAWGV